MRLLVAITGASGAIYARRCLDVLRTAASGGYPDSVPASGLVVDVVASTHAEQVWRTELGETLPSFSDPARPGADAIRRWPATDFAAPFASGSSVPDAVVVIPCSMSTLSRVANGGGDNLIARACDVALKERRPLILVVRETPLSRVHLHNMLAATDAGAIVLPAVPSFYGEAATLEDAIDTVICRALDRAGLVLPLVSRWGTHDRR